MTVKKRSDTMLYKHSDAAELDMELFKNPSKEYRAAPFWAWNCELDKDVLFRQIEYLKQMGFGGFHMHSRSGLATEYLGKEYMQLVKACCEKAKKEDMLAWLYDEDRWASGAAGGYVTSTVAYRQKYLLFTEKRQEEEVSYQEGYETGKPYLLGCYDVVLDKDGALESYKKISPDGAAKGIKRYAYIMTSKPTGWFNNQGYVDVMNPKAIDKFIEVTHEAYKRCVGDEFDKTVPAIFTDEPNYAHCSNLPFAQSHDDVTLAWTYDFDKTYKDTYGDDITEKLPELLWNLPDGKMSLARYHYYDHVCERFVSACMDKCGKWCRENEINFTGHVLYEETLSSQSGAVGEAMRTYRSMTIPGIDMLCDGIELNTAKQAQSVKNQFGREGMTSELYGVTNWDFDFRGHKFQGDWQAALGVTVRVPHLAWVSMKGAAKRDYPASINYQSPWYKKYPYVEDHFARLNTVLTRGKPQVKVGVIHPIESFWLLKGPENMSSDIKIKLDSDFERLTKILLTGFVDFDFISESLLPGLCKDVSEKLTVGKMQYETVIVPECITLRKSTVEILEKFKNNGGRVIFIGECPEYIDAQRTDAAKELYGKSETIPFDENIILGKLEKEATCKVYRPDGRRVLNLLSACRKDGKNLWLFIAHCEKSRTPDAENEEKIIIELDGCYNAELYNTITGETETVDYTAKNGKTVINKTIYAYDSILLKLTPCASGENHVIKQEYDVIKTIDFKENLEYQRCEDNVYILDLAEYRLDGGDWQETEEILRIDEKCRKILGFPRADGGGAQPWVLGRDNIEHFVTLRYEVLCEYAPEKAYIAAENVAEILVNGRKMSLAEVGYFTDEAITKYEICGLNKGVNVIEIKLPIGKRTGVECCYLLGDFDVLVRGTKKTVIKPSRTVGFGDISCQGMPFYGGNVSYIARINMPECIMRIRANRFRGAAVGVKIDGKDQKIIAYAPYTLMSGKLAEGEHVVEFTLYGTRVNTFGALHNCGYNSWIGPNHWYSEGYEFCYEYVLKQTGILASPVIELLAEK